MSLVASSAKRLFVLLSLTAVGYGLAPQHLLAQQSVSVVAAATRPLITQRVDESQRTVLKGNTHPLARPEFDLGTAPDSLPMQRMLLVLKRSPVQEAALRRLLDDQQNKNSSSYHQWLTPAQYGKQFGPTDADMQTITAWLQSHGFQVGTTKGRTVLEFSGTAGQVQQAFQTSIHKYIVHDEQHWANASDPSIPTALTPAVAGVLTLHNFLKKPQIRLSDRRVAAKIHAGKQPELTLSDGTHALSPPDYATIYNINPVYDGSNTGNGNTGQLVTIGVVARSDLYGGLPGLTSGEDVFYFRQAFLQGADNNLNIITNGPDPGDLGGSEEAEATLDATWSGALAPSALVTFVVSATTNTTDGVDLSEVYIIENNIADVMTESFSTCEALSTNSEATGVSVLAEQAAAQGITYFVSTGDDGAEGCDDQDLETVATGPVSANLLASSPFDIAVGGTVFEDTADPTKYWSTSATSEETALSYIPEDIWNDSCPASRCGSGANIVAGSGGASIFFSKPSWQAGVIGIVNDNARDLPDVSLTASLHDGYLLCLEGSCAPDSQGYIYLYLVGGTSASAPAFAGILSLVDSQAYSLNASQGPRQGQANYVLYRLAALENDGLSSCNGSNSTTLPASTCIFNDVTIGNNAVPGEVNYGESSAQYQAETGYDMASGLGSVNVANLLAQWDTAAFLPTTTSLSYSPSSVIHGSPVSINISVTPRTTSSQVPTGDVSLYTGLSAGIDVGFFTLSGGLISSTTNSLPGGFYFLTAQYGGDSNFAASNSGESPYINVTPEGSTTILSVLTPDPSGTFVPFSTIPFGNFVYLRADVAGLSGYGTPTGTVTFNDTFGAIPGGNSFSLNNGSQIQSGSNAATPEGVFVFDTGTHTISASYSGDASFNPSATAVSQSFTVTPGFYANVPTYAVNPVVISAAGGTGQTAVNLYSSTGFTGAITLSCAQLPAGAACQFSPSSVTGTGTAATTLCTITVSTTATAAMLPSPRGHLFARWLDCMAFVFISLVFRGTKRQNSHLLLAGVLTLLVILPSCGSSGSGTSSAPPPPTSTPAGSYSVIVTTASGSTTSSSGFTLIVR